MWGSQCTSIGLSSSGLSNYKWDSVSPSAHKHKNYCQTALSDCLFFYSSLFLQTIDQQLPLQVVFFSRFLICDWKKISDKTHATNENIVKAQVVVCFASELCIFVLIPVDYPSYRGWRGSLCCYGPVSLPDSLRKLSRCVLLIKSVVNATSFSQTQRHYFSLSVCLLFFSWLRGVYWPRADSVILPRVPAGSLDWCPSLIAFRSDTHLIKKNNLHQLEARSTSQRSGCCHHMYT